MKKMIKIESGSFAALVRSYKKSLNMLAVLQHICQENDVALSNGIGSGFTPRHNIRNACVSIA